MSQDLRSLNYTFQPTTLDVVLSFQGTKLGADFQSEKQGSYWANFWTDPAKKAWGGVVLGGRKIFPIFYFDNWSQNFLKQEGQFLILCYPQPTSN